VLLNADAKVTLLLKNTLQRARPSDYHNGFSFPSGHSTSVYFVLGSLFLLVLPLVRSTIQEEAAAGNARGLQRAEPFLQRLTQPQVGAALMLAGGCVTQSGRLLAGTPREDAPCSALPSKQKRSAHCSLDAVWMLIFWDGDLAVNATAACSALHVRIRCAVQMSTGCPMSWQAHCWVAPAWCFLRSCCKP
jgi:hypothetical protein